MSPPSSSGPSRPEDGIHETLAEVRREISCRVCQGDIKRCRLAICPYLDRVRSWFVERRDLRTTNLFGASPPSAFVGSWGYPKVLVGPLVPPVRDEDTSILDASESWLDYDLAEILRFRRRLVPTEWSITAVDDILAKGLIDEVRGNPWTSEFEVTGASGLANNVVVLLFPGAFMFEGLEAWNLEASPTPAHDHEFAGGRTAYPEQIAGAYHATRLPVLEHLAGQRQQAGAVRGPRQGPSPPGRRGTPCHRQASRQLLRPRRATPETPLRRRLERGTTHLLREAGRRRGQGEPRPPRGRPRCEGGPRNPRPGVAGEGGGPKDPRDLSLPGRPGPLGHREGSRQVPGIREGPRGRVGAGRGAEAPRGLAAVLPDPRRGPHGLVVQRLPRVRMTVTRSRTHGLCRSAGGLRRVRRPRAVSGAPGRSR